MDEPAWWPPKRGDRLRHFTLREIDGKMTQVHALVHVLAVFTNPATSEKLATIAEWWPVRQRWHYETIKGWLEAREEYWPDGQDPPRKHPCICCEGDKR
jgi:hypothetical protein